MKYKKILNMEEEKFERLTGVKIETFKKMLEILREEHIKKKAKGGRKNKICVGDMLLMTLEYLREYRTYFHIAVNYGLSESNTYKIIKWTEDTLIKSKEFSLPGKKALLKDENAIEVLLIDATETLIQRPKKTEEMVFWKEKKAHN